MAICMGRYMGVLLCVQLGGVQEPITAPVFDLGCEFEADGLVQVTSSSEPQSAAGDPLRGGRSKVMAASHSGQAD